VIILSKQKADELKAKYYEAKIVKGEEKWQQIVIMTAVTVRKTVRKEIRPAFWKT
jgi:ABC-type polysaccharide transport system permease subunit